MDENEKRENGGGRYRDFSKTNFSFSHLHPAE